MVLGFAGVFLVLVLVVNVATLLLARASKREQEFAVSRALGANGAALMRATLLEGGLLGLWAASGARSSASGEHVRSSRSLHSIFRDARRSSLDWSVGAVVIGVGALLGLLAALVPALWAARTSLASLLASSAVRGGGGHQRMRRGMVVVQVALSLVLLSAGGLVVRSFEQLLRANPGFNRRRSADDARADPAAAVPADSRRACAAESRARGAGLAARRDEASAPRLRCR